MYCRGFTSRATRFLTRLWNGLSATRQQEAANGMRIEALKNGERVCVLGTREGSAISVTVTYANTQFVSGQLLLGLSGIGWHLPGQVEDGIVGWAAPPIEIGDEITMRLLPPGEFDHPSDPTPTMLGVTESKAQENSGPIQFKFLKNGRVVRTAGVQDQGTLVFNFDYAPSDDHATAAAMGIDLSGKSQRTLQWAMPAFQMADELTLRILHDGEFDPPEEGFIFNAEQADDPEFGKMAYQIDAWQFNMKFECGPLKTARVRLRSDETAMTDALRQRIRSIGQRHAKVWPEILKAILNCHESLNSTVEIESRIESLVSIHVGYDSPIEFVYSMSGEDEARYFVSIDNGKVIDASVAG